MTIEHAIDYIYASYLKAEPHMDYNAPDSEKRNPAFSRQIIEKRAGLPTLLVTGSKGKGSVSKMIAEIMGVHCKVGLMTSPHILKFNERIQVQGEPVSDTVLAEAIAAVKPEFDAVEQTLSEKEYISPMGIQAAVALEIFRAYDVDLQVMECGKGVAYDDVNNVPHKYAVINHIFQEHTRELGESLEEIAENKAAIITGDQAAVFTSEQSPEVMAVLRARAEACRTPLYQYGRDFWCEDVRYTEQGMRFDVVTAKHRYVDLQIPLLGTYQAENCALAVALCEMAVKDLEATEPGRLSRAVTGNPRRTVLGAAEQAQSDILDEAKLKYALKFLEWPGRLEVLSAEPLMLLDACINRASCANVLEALEQLQTGKVTTIIGIPLDKDYPGVAEAMASVSEHIILTKSQNAHYKFGTEQVDALAEASMKADWADDVESAIRLTREYMAAEEAWDRPIVILGTTSLISDVKLLAATPEVLL